MKTKGFIYLVSAILVLLVASCEEDHIMTKYTGDAVGFVEDYYFQSVKADFTYLEIPVAHNNLNKSGSKAEVEITLSEGTSANLVSLNTTMLDFDVADTIILQLSIDLASLVEDVEYSISLTFTDAYLQHEVNGSEEVTVEFSKWRPRRQSDYVGDYTVEAVSNIDPGNWDEEWAVTAEADALDVTKITLTGIAYSDLPINAVLDYDAMTITIPAGQHVGDSYGEGYDMYIYNYDENADVFLRTDLVGTLYENGDFSFDYCAMMYGDTDDPDYVWDLFTPTFYKD
ncbi:MAG: hypothetical protein GQ564_14435 [Bacteroidales bacterium]|nr:hypothetical protein [Bacteroidales bacterium]